MKPILPDGPKADYDDDDDGLRKGAGKNNANYRQDNAFPILSLPDLLPAFSQCTTTMNDDDDDDDDDDDYVYWQGVPKTKLKKTCRIKKTNAFCHNLIILGSAVHLQAIACRWDQIMMMMMMATTTTTTTTKCTRNKPPFVPFREGGMITHI